MKIQENISKLFYNKMSTPTTSISLPLAKEVQTSVLIQRNFHIVFE